MLPIPAATATSASKTFFILNPLKSKKRKRGSHRSKAVLRLAKGVLEKAWRMACNFVAHATRLSYAALTVT